MKLKSLVKQRLKRSAFYLIYYRRKHFDTECLNLFVNNYYGSKSIDLDGVKRLLKICFIYGGLRYKEFLVNHFENKTWKERMRFIPACAMNNLYIQVNPPEYLSLLENKGTCYAFFKDFYNRELLTVSKEEVSNGFAKERILDFAARHSQIIIKPLNAAGGKGVKLVSDLDDFLISKIIQDYLNGFVLEEKIEQVEELAAFNNDSVNCVRVITCVIGEKVECKWPELKMGRKGSVVDNVYSGGIKVGIHVEDGKTFGLGLDGLGNTYTVHPDSKKPLADFQIPQWADLLKMLKSMAMLCKECHIIGWDMALTKNGWIVVEANYGPGIGYQDLSPDGFYEDFLDVRKKLHAGKFNGYIWMNQYRP